MADCFFGLGLLCRSFYQSMFSIHSLQPYLSFGLFDLSLTPYCYVSIKSINLFSLFHQDDSDNYSNTLHQSDFVLSSNLSSFLTSFSFRKSVEYFRILIPNV